MKQQMILIRGIPGSGKSTLANIIIGNNPSVFKHYEADMYFTDDNGNYIWDFSRIGAAHSWCQAATHKALKDGYSVIVSNTFTTKKEIQYYLDLAKAFQIVPTVVIANGNFKNVHSVPEETVTRMKERFQHNIW